MFIVDVCARWLAAALPKFAEWTGVNFLYRLSWCGVGS